MSAQQSNFSSGDVFRSRNQKTREIAPFKNGVQFMCKFKHILKRSIQDIAIESSGAPYPEITYIKYDKLRCTKCTENFLETGEFLKHVMACMFTPKEEELYKKFGLITSDVDRVITDSQEVRATTSYIVKNCANTSDVQFTVPIKSPLAPYIFRGISIYFNEAPSEVENVVKGHLQIGDEEHTLYFAVKALERQIANVEKIKKEHDKKKKELARWLNIKKPQAQTEKGRSNSASTSRGDRMSRRMRTAEEEVLEVEEEGALKPENQALLVDAELAVKTEVQEEKENVNKSAPAEIESRRRTPKLERKRLASAFNSNFLVPESSKRVPKQKKPIDF